MRLVVHWCVPATLEGYYQESGRGGRDGRPAHAVLLYEHEDRCAAGHSPTNSAVVVVQYRTMKYVYDIDDAYEDWCAGHSVTWAVRNMGVQLMCQHSEQLCCTVKQ